MMYSPQKLIPSKKKKIKSTDIIFYHNFGVLINNNEENMVGSLFYKITKIEWHKSLSK